jgi:hypothetical protein
MKNCFLALALILAVAPASAAAPPERVPITQARIAAAISDAGLPVAADQVSLLADVAAASAAPALVVESMQPWGDRRMRVRMSCASSDECLPFFVAIRLTPAPGSQSAVAASTFESVDHSLAANERAAPDPKNYVVRSGAAATLLLDGGHVHIRIAVVCLENGAAGQTIRVASKDHRQTYLARVVDQGVLRASL